MDQFTESVEEIVSKGHELAAHGYLHERLAEISKEAEESVFQRGLAAFERVGVKPEGFRERGVEVTENILKTTEL